MLKKNKSFVHESSYVDDNVIIGSNVKIWHFSHIQSGACIGDNTSIGQNVNVANKEWQVVLSDKFNDDSENLIYLFSDDQLKQISQIENLHRYIYFKNGYFYGKGELGNFPIDKY